jgi:hypothetical protein
MTPQEKVRRTVRNFTIFEALPDPMRKPSFRRRVITTCAAMRVQRNIIAHELGLSPETVRSIICRSKQ